ncbi:hypothetical protein PSPO01_01217 [Paraphaeosphaeria sporulosa]
MDMLMALESMARTSATADAYTDVGRWMQLFGSTATQAKQAIEAGGEVVHGLTFRFCGDKSELSGAVEDLDGAAPEEGKAV